MEKTTNYKLFKPELGDRVSIGDINENMDILDEKLKEVDLIKIDKSRILSTKEEVEAVTEEGFLVDALVAAQLNSDYIIKIGTSSITTDNGGFYTIPFATADNCDLLIINSLVKGATITCWYSSGWLCFARRVSDNTVLSNTELGIHYVMIKSK